MKPLSTLQPKDQIAAMLRAEILSGAISDGEELTQEEIATKTGLSRMPVREALQKLEQEGFLVRLSNRHMQAVRLTGDALRQYFRMLAVVLAELCAMRGLVPLEVPQTQAAVEAAFRSLTQLPGNRYLSEQCTRMLESYYLYALHTFGHTAKAAAALEIALQQQTAETLLTYFMVYHNLLTGETA